MRDACRGPAANRVRTSAARLRVRADMKGQRVKEGAPTAGGRRPGGARANALTPQVS